VEIVLRTVPRVHCFMLSARDRGNSNNEKAGVSSLLGGCSAAVVVRRRSVSRIIQSQRTFGVTGVDISLGH